MEVEVLDHVVIGQGRFVSLPGGEWDLTRIVTQVRKEEEPPMEEEIITLELPRQVTLEGRTLRLTQAVARFLLGELLRHIETPVPEAGMPATHMAHSPVLGLVPVSIIACNASACLVRGHLYGTHTGPVRVNKSDLFPLIETLVCEGGDPRYRTGGTRCSRLPCYPKRRTAGWKRRMKSAMSRTALPEAARV